MAIEVLFDPNARSVTMIAVCDSCSARRSYMTPDSPGVVNLPVITRETFLQSLVDDEGWKVGDGDALICKEC